MKNLNRNIIMFCLLLIAIFITTVSFSAQAGNYVALDSSSSEVDVNSQVLITVSIQLDPDTPTSDDPYNKLTLNVPSNFIYDQETINVSDPLNTLGEPQFDNNNIIYSIGEITTGQTIEINFAGYFDDTSVDLQAYTLSSSLTNNGETQTDYATTEIIVNNPTTYEISKRVVTPSPNVYSGDDITYEVKVNFNGTGEINPDIKIVDTMQENASFISATQGGINEGQVTTWNLTDSDIENRVATKRVTYNLDSNYFNVDDVVTNNVELLLNDNVLDSDEVSVTLVDDKEIIIDTPMTKNSYTSTDEDGNLTTSNGIITYKFEPIDLKGSATLSDVAIIDHVGEDLFVKTIYPGKYQGGGELQYIDVQFSSGIPNYRITDTINSTEVPESLQDKVTTVTYYYGDIQLPFKATTPPMIDMTVDPELGSGLTNVKNDFEVDFSITSNDGSIGEGTFTCPPGYSQNTNSSNDAKCTITGTDNVVVANDIPFASIYDTLEEERLYYAGEEIVFNYKIENETDSTVDLNILKIVNDYSASFSYVSNDSGYETVDQDGYLIIDAPITLKPGESFEYNVTYLVEETQVVTSTDDVYVYFDDANQILAGNHGNFEQEPKDYLNDIDNQYYDRVFHSDERVWLNQPQVVIDKEVTDENKVYLPSGVDNPDGDSASNIINYQATLSNNDFGKNSADINVPMLTDTIPEGTTFNENSLVVSGYFNNDDIDTLQITESGFTVIFNKSLPVGESIYLDYSVTLNENSKAGFKTNTIEFIKDPEMKYTDNSIFIASDATALIKPVATQYINKEVDKETVASGGQVTYTITYENTGTVEIRNINFIDELPNLNDSRGTTVSSVVIEQPEFVIGNPSDYSYEYTLFDGTVQNNIPFDRSTIRKIGVNFGDQIINPGDEFKFKYTITTPNDAVNGDLLVNDGTFDSVAYYDGKPYGVNDGKLNNTTNLVETVIVDDNPELSQIGDLVYLDINENQQFDEGIDEPLDNYFVELKDSNNNVIANTVTNNGGQYKFTDLEPAIYTVSIYNDQKDYLLTNQDIVVDTTENRNYLDADFIYKAGSISGTIFHDVNANGIFDDTEEIYENEVNIKLYDNSNNLIEEFNTSTSSQTYQFSTLKSGTYRVVAHNQYTLFEYYYTVQPEYTINDNFTQQTKPDLTEGDDIIRDFGLVKPSKITGYVFEDLDQSGTYIATNGIENVILTLKDDDLSQTSSDNNGYYEFYVYPGQYELTSELVDGYMFSPQQNDSTVDENGETGIINVGEGETLRYDVGQVPLVTIGGNYYEDVDFNKSKSSGDENLEGRTVELYFDNELVMTTVTDSSGNYRFNNIEPNTEYNIRFETYEQEYFNNPKSGIIVTKKYNPAEIDLTLDASVYHKVKISGYVVEDIDYSQDISELDKYLSDYTVELYDSNDNLISTTTTSSDGYYEFIDVDPGTYYVLMNDVKYDDYHESEIVSDLENGFKVHDHKSPTVTLNSKDEKSQVNYGLFEYVKIEGKTFEDKDYDGLFTEVDSNITITVNLYLDNKFVKSTTSVDGYYSFDNLVPGNYSVKVNTSMNPTLTINDSSNISNDLKPNYETDVTTLLSGETDTTNHDIGLYNYVSIGDLVYVDGDQNGQFDSDSERVAPFVTLTLYDEQNNVISSTKTTVLKGKSNYNFTNVVPGTYKIVAENVNGFTYGDTENGINSNQETSYFTVYSGDVVDDKDARLILDIDNPSVVKTHLGDFIWEDTNYNGIYDTDEVGIPNVEVQLHNSDGIYIYSTYTDENGQYKFDVAPGVYKIKLIIDDEYKTNSNLKSSSLDNEHFSQLVAVDLLQPYDDLDFGLFKYSTISGYFVEDLNNNNSYNSNDNPIENVEVKLYDTVTNKVVSETKTDSNGYYSFDTVEQGSYKIVFDYKLKTNEIYQSVDDSIKNERLIDVDYNMDYDNQNGGIIIKEVEAKINNTGFNLNYMYGFIIVIVLLLLSKKIIK